MSEPVIEFQGSGSKGKLGKLQLYSDKLVIVKTRRGLLKKLGGESSGDRTIFIDQITSIQVYPGGLLASGYIRFLLPGSAAEGKYTTRDALRDENAITFVGKDAAKLANQFKEKFEELKGQARSAGAPQAQLSSADEIKKYKQLLDDGILTEEEFNKKKNELLGL